MNNHRPLQSSRCMKDFRMEVNKRRGICWYSFIRPGSEMKLSYCSALLTLIKYRKDLEYPHKIMAQIFLEAYCPRPKFIHICLMKTYINKIKRANCEVCKRLANHQFKLHISSIHRIRVWPVLNTFDLQTYMFQIAKPNLNELNYTTIFWNQLINTFDSTHEIEINYILEREN